MNKKLYDFSVSYNLPKILFEDNKYKTLSPYAKILYAIMLSKLAESVNYKQLDDNGYYIYFTVSSVMDMFNCSKNKALKSKKELLKYGLISEKRQFDKPNKIYVKQIIVWGYFYGF